MGPSPLFLYLKFKSKFTQGSGGTRGVKRRVFKKSSHRSLPNFGIQFFILQFFRSQSSVWSLFRKQKIIILCTCDYSKLVNFICCRINCLSCCCLRRCLMSWSRSVCVVSSSSELSSGVSFDVVCTGGMCPLSGSVIKGFVNSSSKGLSSSSFGLVPSIRLWLINTKFLVKFLSYVVCIQLYNLCQIFEMSGLFA